MRKLILFILLLGLGVYGQTQTLKGYTIGESLGNLSPKVKISVAEVKGTLEALTYKSGIIYEIRFNAITEKEFKYWEFTELINERYKIKLKSEKEEKESPDSPFYGFSNSGVKTYYSDDIYFRLNHSNKYGTGYLYFVIQDYTAVKSLEKQHKEELSEKKRKEMERKLKDF